MSIYSGEDTRALAIASLRALLRPGDAVYVHNIHPARSGRSARLALGVMACPEGPHRHPTAHSITRLAGWALGWPCHPVKGLKVPMPEGPWVVVRALGVLLFERADAFEVITW